MDILIRDALPADLPGVLAIYNDAVLNTTAIWNEQRVDLANRQAWYAARQTQAYPILVAVDAAGEVLGYSSFGDWRPFEGFRHTVEHSVYIRADQRGRGLGPTLMKALIERARAATSTSWSPPSKAVTPPPWPCTSAWASPLPDTCHRWAPSSAAGWT